TLSLAATTMSFAQSYDPDIGSGNIRGGRYGRSYFGGIHPTWRAMVVPHRRTHIRRHRHRCYARGAPAAWNDKRQTHLENSASLQRYRVRVRGHLQWR